MYTRNGLSRQARKNGQNGKTELRVGSLGEGNLNARIVLCGETGTEIILSFIALLVAAVLAYTDQKL
jgi:hypothetical protein